MTTLDFSKEFKINHGLVLKMLKRKNEGVQLIKQDDLCRLYISAGLYIKPTKKRLLQHMKAFDRVKNRIKKGWY